MKYLRATVTKAPSDGTGEFEAIVYDPAAGDVDGVILTPNALLLAAQTFERRGRPLVLRWQHDLDPDKAIGLITRVWVQDEKLFVRGKLDLTNEFAVKIYERLLAGTVNEFSVSWSVPDNGSYEQNGKTFVTDLELLEVSAVSIAANRGTRLVSVKAAPRPDFVDLNRRIKSLTDFGPSVEDRVLAQEKRLLAERMAMQKAAEARTKIAVAALVSYNAANLGTTPPVVFVDSLMRPFIPEEVERERDQREREAIEMRARAEERAVAVAAASSGGPLPDVFYGPRY